VEVVWSPTPEVVAQANVTRLMERAGFDDYRELQRRSAEDPEWFWPLAIEDMGLEFSRPWDRVMDVSRGPRTGPGTG
jgi:acetyl-CoA synthetase